jgi:hypothetical protein
MKLTDARWWRPLLRREPNGWLLAIMHRGRCWYTVRRTLLGAIARAIWTFPRWWSA